MSADFQEFPKMARLSKSAVVTEKIDGTNAQIYITKTDGVAEKYDHCIAVKDELCMFAGSRTRWITPERDNYGFAAWVKENAEMLFGLGEGRHFGEWWGQGIQRKYNIGEKRFSLFNVIRWDRLIRRLVNDNKRNNNGVPDNSDFSPPPECCYVVPALGFMTEFSTDFVESFLRTLKEKGSQAAPGFMNPEGIVVFHIAGNIGFKKTFDDNHKGQQ